MAERRTVTASAHVSPAELADWRAKAVAAGVSLSGLLRQAMARTRTWNRPGGRGGARALVTSMCLLHVPFAKLLLFYGY